MLLERESLLGSLHDHLTAASQGSGSLLLVAGEAGAGKTSLVRGFVESLSASTLVIQGACDPLTTPRPLSPLYDFAADPNSGLDGLVHKDKPAIEMFSEVLDRLRNTVRPIVMVIEDLHWADEGTLDFLKFIGRRIAESRGVLVCTYRDDEVGTDHSLRPVLGQLILLQSTHRLVVPALSLAAITHLAQDRPFDPADLLSLTDGNAFFVTEILASEESLPASVQEAVVARVSRLDEPSRRVVEAVSVAPRSLEIGDAATLAGASLDDVDTALAAGVLIDDGRDLRFRHELARSAVEEALPPARRFGLHMSMLQLLEEERSLDYARLAHHAIKAGEAELVIGYAPRAGREAAGSGSHMEAAAFFEAALQHADLVAEDEAARLRVELANELGIVDRRTDALHQIDLAVDFYRRSQDEEALASTLVPPLNARWRLEDAKRFRDGLQEALTILEAKDPSKDLARAYLVSAYQHMLARRGVDASRDVAKARDTADSVGDTGLAWMIQMLEGTISVVVGDNQSGVRVLSDTVERARLAGNIDDEILGLMMLGSGGGEVRRYDVAIPALEKAVDHGLAADQDYLVAYTRSWLARIAFELARWDDAVDYASLVDRATAYRKGIAILTGLSTLGRVRTRRGDPGASALLDEMVALSHSHELQHGWNAICGRAELYWLRGEAEKGLDLLRPAYEEALNTDSQWARGEIGFWMWRVGAIDGPPEGAAEPFALQMAGDWSAAAQAWRDIGCPYEEAIALADGPEVAKLEALDTLDRLDARPMADRVRHQLRDLGVESIPRGPTKETLSNPAGLTSRQLEVLRLIAGGSNNEQISDELYISKKTVEHHVSAIYSKLGVSSRLEAMRTAAEVGVFEK